MDIPFYQVDAFTSRAFAGNPAAVMPLLEWLTDDVLQAIAAENNLSETAYMVGGDGQYQLRWFTPTTEVNLCGHATLASAYILFQHLAETAETLRFDTRSGALTVSRRGKLLAMDFPAIELEIVREPTEAVLRGLGARPDELLLDSRDRNYYAVFVTEIRIGHCIREFSNIKDCGTCNVFRNCRQFCRACVFSNCEINCGLRRKRRNLTTTQLGKRLVVNDFNNDRIPLRVLSLFVLQRNLEWRRKFCVD